MFSATARIQGRQTAGPRIANPWAGAAHRKFPTMASSVPSWATIKALAAGARQRGCSSVVEASTKARCRGRSTRRSRMPWEAKESLTAPTTRRTRLKPESIIALRSGARIPGSGAQGSGRGSRAPRRRDKIGSWNIAVARAGRRLARAGGSGLCPASPTAAAVGVNHPRSVQALEASNP